ncbi:hypothetical protein K2Z84_21500 [Candidatus Binatia bacterium]|nr:hypothetical protein [Candidatus Binatia bacterium]
MTRTRIIAAVRAAKELTAAIAQRGGIPPAEFDRAYREALIAIGEAKRCSECNLFIRRPKRGRDVVEQCSRCARSAAA